ncbi:MAG: SDR family oxidoreductase [Candidatus Palauibacterales bacterium]|nr:SDR family oxidoreductase [Candidatus Palauibacterales bacterium]MDP2482376.1 SDR family oxidoreductase [Candidatus Palauibacterales bacterium]
MNLGLKDLNCVVLGGSRGIGRAIALGLAEEGANVSICARSEEALHATESEISALGVKVYAHPCDVGDAVDLSAFLDATRRALGSVDVLVHNASALALGPSLSDWETSLQVDLMAGVRAAEQVMPWMEESGGGSILFVSSTSGLEADPAPDFGYTAAKAALIAHAKKLAVMHAPRGIRVNAIAPGSTDFPGGVWSMIREKQPEVYESVRASIPWGRLGTPEEVADVAVFLVSPRAAWISGECLCVDGAQHRGMR